MASKLVIVVALLAASQASPVLINGVFYRDGRAYAIGQASGSGFTQASSNVNGDVAQSYGSSNGGAQFIRDGLYYPGQAVVQTQAYDGDVVIPNQAKAVAQAQNGGYYHVPAPATIVSYQNFAVPSEINYQVPPGAVSAVSRATSDGVNEELVSTVQSSKDGVAISDARTQGLSATHAESKGNGYGSATSNNRFNHGTATTSAKTSGAGSVVTSAKSDGVGAYTPVLTVPVAVPVGEVQPVVIDAKTQNYVPAFGAKNLSQKPISWRFGTYYNVPSSSANAQVNNAGAYPSYAKTSANTNQGFANANANVNEPYGALKYSAGEPNYGSANVNADARSGAYNNAKSSANLQGRGNASSSANTNAAGSSSRSTANTNGLYGISRTNADANTSGSGLARSSAYGGNNVKSANSSVSSSNYGSANAHSESV